MSNRVSAIVVAHDPGPILVRCLESLRDSKDVFETILVDTGSNGPEIEEAAARGLARIVSAGSNVGYGAGCNLGAREAAGDVLLFLNPDTVVDPGAPEALAEALADRAVGIAMPRLRLLDEPELLNSAGNVLHLSGIAWPGGYREAAESLTMPRDIPYASGAAFAMRAELFAEVGGFTEELFLYQEDLELSWRVRLRGLRVIVTPAADVLHRYSYVREPWKHYYLERNRLVFVLTAYSGRLLLLLAPVLVAAELGLAALAWREGWWREKLRGWQWCVTHAAWIAERRRRTQALRRVPDRDLARFLTPRVAPRMTPVPSAVRAANPVLALWWRLVQRLL